MAEHRSEEVRRRQILDAAKRCFIDQGLDATTMRHIAREAHLSLGGIYFHYKSKEEIFRAICEQTYGTVLLRWQAGPAGTETAAERIRALGEANVSLIEHDRDYFRLALVLNGAAVVDDTLKAIKREHHTGYVSHVAGVLEDGIARGELRPHETRPVAEGIVALFDGLYLRCAIDADIHPRATAFAALDLLLEALRRGS